MADKKTQTSQAGNEEEKERYDDFLAIILLQAGWVKNER